MSNLFQEISNRGPAPTALPAAKAAAASSSSSSRSSSSAAAAAAHTATHEVAACDPSHIGLWSGTWEACFVLRDDNGTMDLRIASDGATVKDVPARWVRRIQYSAGGGGDDGDDGPKETSPVKQTKSVAKKRPADVSAADGESRPWAKLFRTGQSVRRYWKNPDTGATGVSLNDIQNAEVRASTTSAQITQCPHSTHTVYQVAACDADHVGPWLGLWEDCDMIASTKTGKEASFACTVRILSDDTVCQDIPSRFVRTRKAHQEALKTYGPCPLHSGLGLSAAATSSIPSSSISYSSSLTSSASSFPDGRGQQSFLHCLRRLSDRNYAMREFCLAAATAPVPLFTTFKSPRVASRCVAWLPRTDSLDAATASGATAQSVLDSFHPDLCTNGGATSTLYLPRLVEAIASRKQQQVPAECLFVNRLRQRGQPAGPSAAATGVGLCAAAAGGGGADLHPCCPGPAISACTAPWLRCVSIVESLLTRDTLRAIASVPSIRGLILGNNWVDASVTDAEMAATLRALPRLRFLFVENHLAAPNHKKNDDGSSKSISRDAKKFKRRLTAAAPSAITPFFGDECWRALGQGCCPELRVLWVDEVHPKWHRRTFADSLVVHESLNVVRGGALRKQLQLLMVNPDNLVRSLSV